MSNFVSYRNLSPSYIAFLSQLSGMETSRNMQDALNILEWKKAILEEMNALKRNETWEMVELPCKKKQWAASECSPTNLNQMRPYRRIRRFW